MLPVQLGTEQPIKIHEFTKTCTLNAYTILTYLIHSLTNILIVYYTKYNVLKYTA